MSELLLDIPEAWWMSSNDRMHWAPKMERTRNVRTMARLLAASHRLPRLKVAQIFIFVQYPPRANTKDPANASPTGKAAIDGLVDYGLLPDDNSRHLLGPDYRLETGRSPVGVHRLRFVITDQEVKF